MLRVIITLLLTAAAFGQWPTSPDTNLVICDRTGEQTLPKVRGRGDFVYVCWQDHSSGNYDTYLQRLDYRGIPQWQGNGLLISSHPQDTWITDYDMAADTNGGDAVLVFNDIRNGTDRDIYAYRIGWDGQFLWGPDGIVLSNNDGFEPDPRVCNFQRDRYAFTWQEETDSGNVVHVRALSEAGTDLFPSIVLTAQYGCILPRIVTAENGAFIVQYLKPQGTSMYSPRHIYAQKFDLHGNAQWAAGGVPVMTTNGIGVQMRPDLVSDSVGGALCYWYDTRDNNRHHVYVQHIRADGSLAWTTNGVQTSLAPDELQMDPKLTYEAYSHRTMLFYMTADLNQNNWGIGGQALDSSGARLWGDNGQSFAALDPRQRFGLQALQEDFGATVVYLENVTSGSMQNYVKGFGARWDGQMEWPNSPRMLCSVNSSKLHLDACRTRWHQVIAAWGDGRAGEDDIYLQNINADGTLGTPIIPRIGTRLRDNFVREPFIMIAFTAYNFTVAPSGGDGMVEVSANGVTTGYHATLDSVRATGLTPGYNTVTLELVHYDSTFLPYRAYDTQFISYNPVSADELQPQLANTFALLPAYPNPFNPRTMLRFSLERDGYAALVVYDVLGRETARPLSGFMTAGSHEIPFDAAGLPGGIYFCRLHANGKTAVQKMMLLK